MSKILGCIDTPSPGSRHPGPTVQVAGWAYSSDGPVSSVRIEVNGRARRAGICRYRPDVAAALNMAGAAASGFEAEIELFEEQAEITAVAILADGSQGILAKVSIAVAQPQKHGPAGAPVSQGDALSRTLRKSNAEPIRLLIAARSLDRGGSQLRMAELVRHLCKDPRFQVEVLSPSNGTLRADLEACGAHVEHGVKVCLTDPTRYEADLAALTQWARGRFDLMFGFTMTSFPIIEAACRLGLPSVLRVGENEPIAIVAGWTGNPLCPEVEARYRRAVAAASVVFSVSQAALDTQRALGVNGPFTLIRNGVLVSGEPLGQARRLQARAALGLHPGRRLMLCPGSLWPVKGQSLLAEAFGLVAQAHPDIDLVLIGQGANEAYLDGIRNCIRRRQLADRLRIEPMTPDMLPWLSASDIVVCASESESMPNAVLEALAIGLPVVATSVGDLPLMITEGITGWLSPPCDLAGLAGALDRALKTDPGKLASMGRLAQERVRSRYEQAEIFARLTDLLATLPSGRVPGWLSFC